MNRALVRSLALAAAVVTVATLASAPAAAADLGLVQTLVGKLGISEAQAAGGARAVFALAKTNLSPAEMGQLAGAVPEVGSLLGEASAAATTAAAPTVPAVAGAPAAPPAASQVPAAALASPGGAAAAMAPAATAPATPAATTPATSAPAQPAAALGAATALAGGAGGAGGLGNLGALTQSFGALGMDAGMVQKFVPVVIEYVGGKGGGAAALLQKGLGL